MTKNYALYIRTASKDQTNDNDSADNQLKQLTEFCDRMKMTNYVIYMDSGYSANNKNRPAFVRLINDIQQNKVNGLLVTDFSRLSRSAAEFLSIKQICDEHKVDMYWLQDSNRRLPFGYHIDNKTSAVIPTLEESQIIKHIFASYLDH